MELNIVLEAISPQFSGTLNLTGIACVSVAGERVHRVLNHTFVHILLDSRLLVRAVAITEPGDRFQPAGTHRNSCWEAVAPWN